MVILLQGYVGAFDAEAVELSVMDRRWQLVHAEEMLFSQGVLQAFRERMIAHELDRALLERTFALVREGRRHGDEAWSQEQPHALRRIQGAHRARPRFVLERR